MKTSNTVPKTVNTGLKSLSLSIAVLMSLSLGFMTPPVIAESAVSGIQGSQTAAVKKPADGKGKLPSFAEADVNSDHVITKNELQNFPYMLQTFNKVDAGEDGKLEQHEYENLKMETKREGEVR